MALDAPDLTRCNHALYLFIVRADRQGNDYLIDLLSINDHLRLPCNVPSCSACPPPAYRCCHPRGRRCIQQCDSQVEVWQNTAYEVVGPVVRPDEEETTDITDSAGVTSLK